VAYFKVLSRHFPEGTEENSKKNQEITFPAETDYDLMRSNIMSRVWVTIHGVWIGDWI
jgi:hypothetical protein